MTHEMSFDAWNCELCATLRRSNTSTSFTDDELIELKKMYDFGHGPLAGALWLLQHRGESTRDKRFTMLRLFLDKSESEEDFLRKPR